MAAQPKMNPDSTPPTWQAFQEDEFAPLAKHVPALREIVARTVFEDGHMEPTQLVPSWLEAGGRFYTSHDRDQADARRHVECTRAARIIERLGGADARKALVCIQYHLREERDKALLETIKEAGGFLMRHQQDTLWKLLYLDLRHVEGAVADLMMGEFPVDAYREDDEYRFLWGKGWRLRLENQRETEGDTERERAALEVPVK